MTSIPTSLNFHTDELTRRLYAGDASLYEQIPVAVTFPRNGDDFSELISYAKSRNLPITMRAAGTSLAGQTTGGGVVADISRYMNRIMDIDPVARTARVQPGVIRDQLNREAAASGLLFGPDTSTTNRCMLGGMIGNNSCGSYSIKYGTTREHVVSLDVVLSDGSKATFRPISDQELDEKMLLQNLEGAIYRTMVRLLQDNKDLIREKYPHPDIKRRNTGYALDRMCEMHPFTPGGRPFNLCELLCGSEGTLALVTEATVRLVPVEKENLLVISQFESLHEALCSTLDALTFGPAAVELTDRYILEATKGNIEQRRNRFFLKGDPDALLIIEFQGDDILELRRRAGRLMNLFDEKGLGYAHSVTEKPDEISRVWDLRKAGLGLLMGYLSDSNSPEFVDDTAVRVEDLPDYIADFKEILKKYDTDSVYYAHASVGELHLRPIINIKTKEGLEKLKAIAIDVAELLKKYRGSLSGEHGDGRIRSHLIERMMGPEILSLLRTVKQAWDPDSIFNRGKIVDPEPMEKDLRYSPAYKNIEVDTVFKWRTELGFGVALEFCNGAGACRKKSESGGTMCPSYMATLDEKDTTRGRANIFRQIFSEQQQNGFTSGEIKEALELCLSCKACKTECPANVDMAKMKAEFTHGWHQANGIPLASRFFGNATKIYPFAAKFAPIINYLNTLPPVKGALEQLFNIHPERTLPAFAGKTFTSHYNAAQKAHEGRNHRSGFDTVPVADTVFGKPSEPSQSIPAAIKSDSSVNKSNPAVNKSASSADKKKVLLIVDWFTDYHDPAIAAAAVNVLKALDIYVAVAGPVESGRTHLSRGLLDSAKLIAEKNIRGLKPYVDAGYQLVGLEPSEILTFRDEYPDLCDDDLLDDAHTVGDASLMFEEFLANEVDQVHFTAQFNGIGQAVYVHGHCHAKALTGVAPILTALEMANYRPVDMKTGCCGMAGSFGYEAKNYDVSMQIGELTLFPSVRKLSGKDIVCAHGFSCRHQITDGTGRSGKHTAEIIWDSRKYDPRLI